MTKDTVTQAIAQARSVEQWRVIASADGRWAVGTTLGRWTAEPDGTITVTTI